MRYARWIRVGVTVAQILGDWNNFFLNEWIYFIKIKTIMRHELGFFKGFLFILCLWLYILSLKFLVFRGYGPKSVRACFIWSRNEYYITCVRVLFLSSG